MKRNLINFALSLTYWKVLRSVKNTKKYERTHQTFTCLKSTIKTVEKGMKYVQTIKTPERRHRRRSNVFNDVF